MTAVTCWLSALARTVVQPAQLHEFHPERQDAVERAVQGRLVQSSGQRGIRAVGFDSEIREGLAPDIAQATSNGDPVAVRTHVPLHRHKWPGMRDAERPWHRNYIR